MNLLVSTPLWRHGNTTDLLDLGIVWRTYAIKVSSNLSAQVSYAYKLLQDIFGHDISISSFLHKLDQNNISKIILWESVI